MSSNSNGNGSSLRVANDMVNLSKNTRAATKHDTRLASVSRSLRQQA